MKIKTKNSGFTLIESMVVLFIIGLLSFIGVIGFSKVNRIKSIEKAASKISFETNSARDFALFGKEINGIYPCGYGIVLDRYSNEIKNAYISGAGVDRISAMENDKSCDDYILNQTAELNTSAVFNDVANLTLDKVQTDDIHMMRNGTFIDLDDGKDCLVVLFSAPRGKAYWCSSSDSECPPSSCTFQPFSEVGTVNQDLSLVSLLFQDNSSIKNRSCLSIYPSGNTALKADVSPNCYEEGEHSH